MSMVDTSHLIGSTDSNLDTDKNKNTDTDKNKSTDTDDNKNTDIDNNKKKMNMDINEKMNNDKIMSTDKNVNTDTHTNAEGEGEGVGSDSSNEKIDDNKRKKIRVGFASRYFHSSYEVGVMVQGLLPALEASNRKGVSTPPHTDKDLWEIELIVFFIGGHRYMHVCISMDLTT